MNQESGIASVPSASRKAWENGTSGAVDKLRILEAGSGTAVVPKNLIARLKRPKTTIYRGLKQLRDAGLLERCGKGFRTTPAGQSHLRKSTLPAGVCTQLEEPWPWLEWIPVSFHRAFVECFLFAVIARRAEIGDDHYPSFIASGPTQRAKSTTALMICYLAGADVKKAQQLMPAVRKRGLLTRLNSKGEKAYECEALKESVVWLEEASLGDPTTKRDLVTMIHGSRRIRIENQDIDAMATLLLELNPKEDGRNLEERLGFAAPQIRRCIVLELTDVPISRSQITLFREGLKKIRKMGPAWLPDPPSEALDPGLELLVQDAFNECINPEGMNYVDIGRVFALIGGARAVLTPPSAVKRVLRNYFLLGETTGLVHGDWQVRLDRLFQRHEASLTHPSSDHLQTDTKPASESHSRTLIRCGIAVDDRSAAADGAHPSGDERNPYSLDENLLELKQLLAQAGLRIPEDKETIAAVLRSAGILHKQGVRGEDLPAMIQDVVPARSFRRRMRELRIAEATLPRLAALDRLLRGNGIFDSQVPEFLELHQTLRRMALDRTQAETLAQALQDARSQGKDGAAAAEFLLELATEGRDLFAQIQDLTDRKLELAAHNTEAAEQFQHQIELLQRQGRLLRERTQELRALRGDCEQAALERDQALKDLQGLFDDIQSASEALQDARALERELSTRTRATWIVYLALFGKDVAASPRLLDAIESLRRARSSGADAERITECVAQILESGAELIRDGVLPDGELPEQIKQLAELQERLAKGTTALAQMEGELDAKCALNPLLAIFRAVLFPKNAESNVEPFLLLQKVCRLLQVRQVTWREGLHAPRFVEQVADVTIHAMGMGLIKQRAPTVGPASGTAPAAAPASTSRGEVQDPTQGPLPLPSIPIAPELFDLQGLSPTSTPLSNPVPESAPPGWTGLRPPGGVEGLGSP